MNDSFSAVVIIPRGSSLPGKGNLIEVKPFGIDVTVEVGIKNKGFSCRVALPQFVPSPSRTGSSKGGVTSRFPVCGCRCKPALHREEASSGRFSRRCDDRIVSGAGIHIREPKLPLLSAEKKQEPRKTNPARVHYNSLHHCLQNFKAVKDKPLD